MAFSDDELRAIEVVREIISDQMKSTGTTLQGLAVEADIPLTTLHRTYSKRECPLKHHYFRSLLNVITKSEKRAISLMLETPYYRKYAERQRIYIDCVDQINDPIEKALLNTATFKIAFMATFGTSNDEIRDEYGSQGMKVLKNLIDKKVIDRCQNGSVILPDFNIPALESAVDIIKNVLSLLKENSNDIDEIKLTFHRIDSITYAQILDDIREVGNKISLRMKQCNNKGDKKAAFGLFFANIS
jgi:lambda repressor-like predicted transcriptional regulator